MQLVLVALVVIAAVVGAGCGSSAAETPQRLALERWSPPQHTSYDVFLAGRGDVVVMARRYSRDGGATWLPLDPRLGILDRVEIVGSTIALHAPELGLTRWHLDTDALEQVGGAPPYATDRTWRSDPTTGRFLAFDPVENALAVERGGGWLGASLPLPTATEPRPYIKDLESNGATLLTVSAWGIHRSVDGGATWQLVRASLDGDGRDLLVLADRRFMLVGGATTSVFDAGGGLAGTMPGLPVDNGEARVCENGTIIARGKLTRDLGASWQPLIASGELQLIAERGGCSADRYWVLVRSHAWGYRLVRFDGAEADGLLAGNWEAPTEPSWTSGGALIARGADGTFLVAGLAWSDGEPGWTLRDTPSRTWASGPTVFGVARPQFYTSGDGGRVWTATAAVGLEVDEPEAFAHAADGSLHVSRFTGETVEDTRVWRAVVWRSDDDGATWAVAYDATATRTSDDELVGEVHRFVGITDDGTWIATDAVSRDAGVTWRATDVRGDRSLAFLTRAGSLVTTLPASSASQDVWRVYADGGLGDLRATLALEVDGTAVPASSLRSVAFDDDGYAYVARGAPYAQVWRTAEPLE